MNDRWDVVVVGAGITGLAAAYELGRHGRSVLVVERTAVAAEQSAGLVRIFRILHGNPHLCALAAETGQGWQRWQDELGVGRLLGSEGLVSIGPLIAAQAAAMRSAGAAVVEIGAGEIAARVPVLAADRDWGDAIVDPAAGVLRIRRIHAALAARLDIVIADVTVVEQHDGEATVRFADGTVLHAGHVLLCAGVTTGPLAAGAGIHIDLTWTHHVRLTYAARDGQPLPPSAAVVLESAYGLPVGSTGRWALGLDNIDDPADIDAAAYAAAVRRQHAAWLPANMPSLDPDPIDEVRCHSLDAPWLDGRGDGFLAARNGRVIACSGSNMMKFGPVLGDRLARTVMATDDDVHPDLRPVAATESR